ncbi:3-deoxy-manno-octulosonate cytidylyltransferase [Desulfatitalea alkaliphila]|uniref:3-deoxy-manno-octulosonate cytidylyltransferase n=1 Tax=Desulfatitalea alkaliphila TaxID=2929485 RepID=A0AA41ULA0_9BACT|nr:3-deoxy-manno-octulosonate cytidylyltransferase [Desulfatitalea alkaliphila]MCJ8501271.1 3-deoxy-manno-octulosonate cytidylyltransferase [Desulfatitalea alkaliphila]
MRIVAIIPARYGSTRFEGKPLAPIAGKPMIQHVYESAARAQRVSEVVVATDDQRIADAVGRFGGRVRMTSAENRSGTDRVAEVAEQMALAGDDIVINVQGDQPLVRSACFDAVVAPLLADADLGMSTLAFVIRDWQEYTNPKDCKVVMDQNSNALYFSRAAIPFDRDGLPEMQAFKHLGVYAYTRRFLDVFRQLPTGHLERMEKLEQLRALEYGHTIKVVITPYDSPEVDLPEDIARIEKMLTAM